MKWRPLPPQGPSGWFPWFIGTMRRCDLLTVVSPHFVAFAWRYLERRVFVPFGRRRQADGSSRSLLYRLLPIRLTSWNCQDLPCSRETLITIRPVLGPRRDQHSATGPRVNVLDTAPAPKHNEGSPRLQISGLNHTAFGLAVYASKWKLPATDKTRFRLLVPALRTGFDPQGFYERFLNWNSFSFPELHRASFVLALFYQCQFPLIAFTDC